jgi:WD40 repeat protein
LERYAVAGTDGVVSVRRISDDSEVAHLVKPADNLYWRPFEFSPDGRLLAVNSLRKSRVCIWNLQTGGTLIELEGTAAGFSADSRKLVLNDPASASLLLQDLVETNQTVRITSGAQYYHVVVDHEGKRLVALSGEKGRRSQATIFDIATGSEVTHIPGEEDEELWCAWQPGGRYLAFTGESLRGVIRIYDVVSGEQVKELNGHPHFVPGLAFNPEGNLLASSSWDDTTRLWSFPAGRELLRVYGAGWPTFSLDGRKFGLCSWEQSTLYLFELAPPPPEARRFEMAEKPQESCEAIAFNSTGEVLAHTDGGRNIIVRNAATLEPIAFLTNNVKHYVARDPNTSGFLVGGEGRCLRFPIEHQSATRTFRVGNIGPWGPTNAFGPTVLTSDGRFMAGVDDKADIYVVDLTGHTAQRCVGQHKRTSFLAISPEARWVATCAWNDNHVRIWNVEKQSLERDLASEGMASLIFSPDGRRLVTNGRSVEFWKVGDWSVDLRIARPPLEGFPVPMTFSPDGRILAVCPSTRSVRLVDSQTGLEYATLELPNPWWIANMSFSPDGSQLALSGAWTQEFCVWDLRRIRERLAALKLDWDLPPYPLPKSF